MEWKITYYNKSIEEAVLAKYARLTELMKEHGMNLGMPHTKAIGNGLFELRLKGKEGIARAFYCTVIKKEILMLHLITKKTQKISIRELDIARKRLKEIKK